MTPPRHRPLVTQQWALDHLDDPTVRFVEVDVDTSLYDQVHLPGAVGWSWTDQLTDPVRRDIAGPEAFGRLLSLSGIGPDTTVVLYGDHDNWFAAWAYWQLTLYGHRDRRLLDGGRRAWVEAGHATTADVPVYAPTGYRLGDPDYSLRAFRSVIEPRIGDPELVLVDVRSPAEFTGEVLAPPGLPEMAQRGGHIPGAVSIPWAKAVREDGTFKDDLELRQLYEGQGVYAHRDVITYCRIGERSAHSWFVLHELLGYPSVRNYDGSWTEWGSLVRAPIEKAVPVTAG